MQREFIEGVSYPVYATVNGKLELLGYAESDKKVRTEKEEAKLIKDLFESIGCSEDENIIDPFFGKPEMRTKILKVDDELAKKFFYENGKDITDEVKAKQTKGILMEVDK